MIHMVQEVVLVMDLLVVAAGSGEAKVELVEVAVKEVVA